MDEVEKGINEKKNRYGKLIIDVNKGEIIPLSTNDSNLVDDLKQ